MSSRHDPIQQCHGLLKLRDFRLAQHIARMNQFVSSKQYEEFEKVLAICDVLIAAETRLPGEMLDYYGMIRMNRPGPVSLEKFGKLLDLLDEKHNNFPCREEAVEKAMLGWSVVSQPHMTNLYDDVFPVGDYDRGTQGYGPSDGGSGSDGNRNGESTMGCPNIANLSAPEYLEVVQEAALRSRPVFTAKSSEDLHNDFQSEDTSSVPKKHKLGPETDDEVVVISDDDDDDDNDDGQEIITMARTAKLCKINGKRVKIIPLKKKRNIGRQDCSSVC